MNKQFFAALLAALLFAVVNVANGDNRIGGQLDFGETSVSLDSDSNEESSTGLGGFFQSRGVSQNGVVLGLHIGYGQANAEIKESGLVNGASVTVAVEQKEVFDVGLVIAGDKNPRVNPFAMLAYSTAKFDSTVTVDGLSDTDSVRLNGFKLVAGIEGQLSPENYWHLAYSAVDYGEDKWFDSDVDIKGERSGFVFGISFGF